MPNNGAPRAALRVVPIPTPSWLPRKDMTCCGNAHKIAIVIQITTASSPMRFPMQLAHLPTTMHAFWTLFDKICKLGRWCGLSPESRIRSHGSRLSKLTVKMVVKTQKPNFPQSRANWGTKWGELGTSGAHCVWQHGL